MVREIHEPPRRARITSPLVDDSLPSDEGPPWGVQEHETVCKVVAKFGEWDGIDPSNSAGIEILLRKAQLIEYVYSDKGPAGASTKGGGKGEKKKEATSDATIAYEAGIFSRASKEFGDIIIAPELLDYVSKEVERDAAVMKQVRKAREERAAAG